MPACAHCKREFSSAVGTDACPRVLPCGHTFCHACLASWLASLGNDGSSRRRKRKGAKVASDSLCPNQCTLPGFWTVKRLASMGAADFPPNQLLLEQMQSAADGGAAAKHGAEVCEGCEARAADVWCAGCETPLCAPCFSEIHKSPFLANHTSMPLEDRPPPPVCHVHAKADAELYCMEHRALVCVACVRGDCRGHEVLTVANAAKAVARGIEENSRELVHHLNQLQSNALRTQKSLAALSSSAANAKMAVSDAIAATKRRLSDVLYRREAELAANIDGVCAHEVALLGQQHDQLRAVIGALRATAAACDKASRLDGVELLARHAQLAEQVDDVLARVPAVPDANKVVEIGSVSANVDVEEVVAKVVETLQGLCSVRAPLPAPAVVTVVAGARAITLSWQGVADNQGGAQYCVACASEGEAHQHLLPHPHHSDSDGEGKGEGGDEEAKEGSFEVVYEGSQCRAVVAHRKEDTQYALRVRVGNVVGWGPWSKRIRVVTKPWGWDPALCGESIDLDSGRLVATHSGASTSECVVKGSRVWDSKSVVVYWEVKILHTEDSSIYVGVCEADAEPTPNLRKSYQAWLMRCVNGSLWGQDKRDFSQAGLVKQHDVLGVRLSLRSRTVSFFLNGKRHGEQHCGVGAPLRAVVVLYHRGDQVELISDAPLPSVL